MTAARVMRGRPRSFDRSQALRSAQRLIWQHGFEAMSLSQLELTMGIGKTSFYAAFGSKLGLLKEAADLYVSEAGGKLRMVLDAAPSAREAMAHFLTACAADFTDPSRPRGCFLVTAAPVCSAANGRAIEFLKQRRAAVAALIIERLKRGRLEGDLDVRISETALAEYIMTVVHGMSIQARDGRSEAELLGTAALAMSVFDAEAFKPPPSSA